MMWTRDIIFSWSNGIQLSFKIKTVTNWTTRWISQIHFYKVRYSILLYLRTASLPIPSIKHNLISNSKSTTFSQFFETTCRFSSGQHQEGPRHRRQRVQTPLARWSLRFGTRTESCRSISVSSSLVKSLKTNGCLLIITSKMTTLFIR